MPVGNEVADCGSESFGVGGWNEDAVLTCGNEFGLGAVVGGDHGHSSLHEFENRQAEGLGRHCGDNAGIGCGEQWGDVVDGTCPVHFSIDSCLAAATHQRQHIGALSFAGDGQLPGCRRHLFERFYERVQTFFRAQAPAVEQSQWCVRVCRLMLCGGVQQ